jgi:hypothetical protein
MFTGQNQVEKTKLTVTVTVILAMGVLTGCQSSPYSAAENEVYRHFHKWSRKVPDGLVAVPTQDSGAGEAVYEYRDSKPGMVVSRKKRMVRGVLGADRRELWAADATPPRKGEVRFLGLLAYKGDYDFAENTQEQESDPFVIDAFYTLQSETEAVNYFRQKGTSVWRRCRIAGRVWSNFVPEKRMDCLRRAEEVPVEQVQRYIDLAARFYETYFFIK